MSDHPSEQPPVRFYACGPSTAKCKCECAYHEDGKGLCEHQWDGPDMPYGSFGEGATCSRCGMHIISHALWTGD